MTLQPFRPAALQNLARAACCRENAIAGIIRSITSRDSSRHDGACRLVPVERCSSPANARESSATTGLVPVELLLASIAPRIIRHDGARPSSGSSPACAPKSSRHDGARPRRAMLLASSPRIIRHDGARPRRAMLLASMPQNPPATTGLVPVERCSSPAKSLANHPPRRGSSPSSDAPRQQTPHNPPATTGLVPVERCSSPASARESSATTGLVPVERCSSPASARESSATTGLVPVERCSSPA